MAFNPAPQSWLGAAMRVETGISLPATAGNTTQLTINGTLVQNFLKNDDPVYFDNTFDTITANTIYYVKGLTTSGGNTLFNLAAIPSWAGTQTNKTWTNGISKNVLLPSRIWLTTQNSGISGVPAGLATLDPAKAHRTTGDIRYLFLELIKMIFRLWEATATSDRPLRLRCDRHDFIADPTNATRNYTMEVDLSYATTAIAAEPS